MKGETLLLDLIIKDKILDQIKQSLKIKDSIEINPLILVVRVKGRKM